MMTRLRQHVFFAREPGDGSSEEPEELGTRGNRERPGEGLAHELSWITGEARLSADAPTQRLRSPASSRERCL